MEASSHEMHSKNPDLVYFSPQTTPSYTNFKQKNLPLISHSSHNGPKYPFKH